MEEEAVESKVFSPGRSDWYLVCKKEKQVVEVNDALTGLVDTLVKARNGKKEKRSSRCTGSC
jgi:hypothetical protein